MLYFVFSLALFTGCNSQTQTKGSDISNIGQQAVITPTSIPVRKRPVKVNKKILKFRVLKKNMKKNLEQLMKVEILFRLKVLTWIKKREPFIILMAL